MIRVLPWHGRSRGFESLYLHQNKHPLMAGFCFGVIMIIVMFKKIIQRRLERYVKKYFQAHPEVKLVVVAGSVGKTSTKMAIATVLSQRYKVRVHEGNHNTSLSAPLAILGVDYPGKIKSPLAWWSVFKAAQERISQPADVDVIIQELGVDKPGDMAEFGRYLLPEIAVVTSVTAEHMEFFKTIDSVAKEELGVTDFSKLVVINRDDIDGNFAKYLENANLTTYGTSGVAEYRFVDESFSVTSGHSGLIITPEYPGGFAARIQVIGEHNLRPVIGAATVGLVMGLSPEEVVSGVELARPVKGRMNPLRGLKGSLILDDSYNSSPLAAECALTTLYGFQSPQRIAILGSMNELGESSAVEHKKLGEMCDPSLLDWVITIGDEAEKHLAEAARLRGCQVRSFKTAIDAGAFALKVLDDDAVVLAKGSQGGIFVEEAIKFLLHDGADEEKLVRQSVDWMEKKNELYSKFA